MTASHAKANDCIVHFGHCCLSTEQKEASSSDDKTIIYVLPTSMNNLRGWVDEVKEMIDQQIVNGQDDIQVLIYCDLKLL